MIPSGFSPWLHLGCLKQDVSRATANSPLRPAPCIRAGSGKTENRGRIDYDAMHYFLLSSFFFCLLFNHTLPRVRRQEMVRILHTADWQIGLRASHVARVGDQVRRARMDAARATVEKANSERVDALVLAGDIFEDNHVDNGLVFEVVRVLSAATVPVFVLPGNHDPLSQDSVYRRASFRERSANIRLLDGFDPVEIAAGRGLLLPAPLSLKKSVEDPTDSLRVPENGDSRAVLIGVAHGSLKIEGKYGRDDFPIALDAAQKRGLNYLALGHWHGRYVHGERIAYSGTLETTKFGEDNSGMALLVECVPGARAPAIQEFRTGRLLWVARELDLSQGVEGEVARVRQELSAYSDHPDEKLLLRLRTVGESTADAELVLKSLEEEMATRFLHFELDRRDIPSNIVQGRLAKVAERHPFVSELMQSLMLGQQDEDLKSASAEEIVSARRILTELLTMEGL
jgi:DNA repair exonuclease SbcCD nuclease subunit